MKLKYKYSFQKYDKKYLAIVDFTETDKERRMIWVNDCGKRILELLQEEITSDDIVKELVMYYTGDATVITNAVERFIKELSEAGLLVNEKKDNIDESRN